MWDLKYGKKLDWFEQLETDGYDIPALKDKIGLYPDLIPDYKAFSILNGSRRIGMTEGPIPISDILAYCQMFEIKDYDQRRHFLKRMKILDNAYLQFDKDS